MTWAGAVFLVVGFLAIAGWTRLPERAVEVVRIGRSAIADLRDPRLDDDAKERTMRSASRRLLLAFVVISACAALALGVPAGVVAAAGHAGWLDFDAVVAATLSWPFLLGATLVALAGTRIHRGQRR